MTGSSPLRTYTDQEDIMVKFVCDSSCDLLTMEGVNFETVPLTISTDERSFVDDADLNITEMLDYLASYKGRSYTACPSIAAWLQAFSGAKIVFAAALTSGLSGAYNSAMAAKNLYLHSHPTAKIHVFNTLTTGPELRLLMEKIVDLYKKGCDFETICAEGDAYVKTTHVFFSFQSLHNFAQNGRINKAVAAACGVLNIRIVGTGSEDGKIEPLAKCRGDKKAMAELISQLDATGFKKGKLRLAHTENPTLAETFRAKLQEHYPEAEIIVYEARGLCSYYGERGGIFIGSETC